jgi:hypothetical protein
MMTMELEPGAEELRGLEVVDGGWCDSVQL